MADAPEIEFHAASWNETSCNWLRKLGDADGSIGFIQRRVEAGDWQLLELSVSGNIIGACVYSIEHEPKGNVIVINYLAGRFPGVDLTVATFEFFDRLQRVMGIKTVRLWTARTGLKRKLEAKGFATKFVMERRL